MKEALDFIGGVIAHSNLVLDWRFVLMRNNRVYATNGGMSACARCDTVSDIVVCGDTLRKLIRAFKDDFVLIKTPKGKIKAKSGKHTVFVPTSNSYARDPIIDKGVVVPVEDNYFVDQLRTALVFTQAEGSALWNEGVCFEDGVLTATNTAIVIQNYVGKKYDVLDKKIVLPGSSIAEIVRIKRPLTKISFSEKRVIFYYDIGWISVDTMDVDFQDMTTLFAESDFSCCRPVPDTFFKSLEKLKLFAGEFSPVYFKKGKARTSLANNTGAVVDSVEGKGCFSLDYLLLLAGVATTIDFSAYPEPCPFKGDHIRGLIVGRSK